MKIAHIADTHIKNLKNHDEYRYIFNEIYKKLQEESVDYIVHCGDIVHSKTQISPELVDMVTDFLDRLSGIAPTIIILGNHDGNLKNSDRQDAISPIVKALGKNNIYLIKEFGEVIDTNNKIVFSGLSIFDEKNWKKPSKPEYINVALYHGPIAGVTTDTGYILEHSECSLDTFSDYDYIFLGDIHKTNQIVDTEGKVRYPGSTVQQNFGETDDKGFLIWDIKDKNKFTCKHYSIDNPNPFVSITLDSEGNLPEVALKDNSRIRIIADNSISLEKIKKAVDIIKNKNNPASIITLNKSNISKFNEEIAHTAASNIENLRDLSIQETLIRDYLKDYKAEPEVIDKVIELNNKFSAEIHEEDDIYRGINWKIKSLEWDNLFNYGQNNKINFENMNGVVGIFGKNYSGKSSVIDSLLYSIYNSTSKNNRKNLNVINQKMAAGFAKVTFDIGGETYFISRKSEKYTKKLKGVTTTEAKTDVEFSSSGDTLNGVARNDTDKMIRKYFGTIDDFFLTSMASQFGYLSFISEGSTNRKSILAKFLDLDLFEKKFKLAREESSQLKVLLKKLEGNNYDREILSVEALLNELESNILNYQNNLESLKEDINNKTNELKPIIDQLKTTPLDVSEYFKLFNSLNIDKKNLKTYEEANLDLKEQNIKYNELILKLENFIKLVDEKQLLKDDAELDKMREQMIPLEKEISVLEANIKGYSHKLKLLEDIPCGDQFTSCKFIKDAFQAKEKMARDEGVVADVRVNYRNISDRYDALDQKTANGLNKLGEVKRKKDEIEKKRAEINLKIADNLVLILKLKSKIEKDQANFDQQEKDREIIEKLDELNKKKSQLERNLALVKSQYEMNDRELRESYKKEGSLKQKLEFLQSQKKELEETRKIFSAYDLYMSSMHSSGISYEIIKKKLPLINEEINKILSSVVDFTVYLVNDEDKLDLMIKHGEEEARPLEMGSGAEKTLASTAMRLALLTITTLPKGDLFILDEPGTSLDNENLDGFVKILELIKLQFKNILLISHLDSLKDCVDKQISIQTVNNFAHINE